MRAASGQGAHHQDGPFACRPVEGADATPHIDSQPIGKQALRYAWARATKRAGVPGRLIHDLRRTAARDFRRAGVDEGTIMKLCGWEARSMFDRYNVIDEQDLASAVAKRYGTVVAQSKPSTESSPDLS